MGSQTENISGNERKPDGTSDVYGGFRRVFKLPPGLCLVKCDSLRPGQTPLNPDEVLSAIETPGTFGTEEAAQ